MATAYAAEDADVTLRLFRLLSQKVGSDDDASYIYHTLERPLIPVIARMERRGILVDRPYLPCPE